MIYLKSTFKIFIRLRGRLILSLRSLQYNIKLTCKGISVLINYLRYNIKSWLTLSGQFLLIMKGKMRWSKHALSSCSFFSQPYMKTFSFLLWPWRSQYRRTFRSSIILLQETKSHYESFGYWNLDTLIGVLAYVRNCRYHFKIV